MPIAGILFDVDETLFDRRRAQQLVLARLPQSLPELFGNLDEDTLRQAWDRSDAETADHTFTDAAIDTRTARNVRSALFLRLLKLPEAQADAVTDFYLTAYKAVESPIDGAADTVARCRDLLPIGVVSNAYPDVQYAKLQTLGLRDAFECIVLSEEYGGPRKPAPEIFLHGCQLLGVAPGETLYVGDSWGNDVVGARAAGLIPCWFNPDGKPVPDGEQAPPHTIQRLSDVLDVISDLIS